MAPLQTVLPWRNTPDSTMTGSDPLTFINVVNFLLFLASSVVVVGIGGFGVFGVQSIREVSAIYPTLMTPVYWVPPTVWILLLASLAVWAVAQLLPKHRTCPLQVQGVGFYYSGVALAQIVWILSFSYQLFFISIFAVVLILVFLFLIRHNQTKLGCPSWQEYFIHKFPFSLYIGWTLPLLLWNINVILVYMSVDLTIQFFVAIVSIAEFVAAVGILSLCSKLDCVIPLVISFFTIGICVELYDPSLKISRQFADGQILAIQITSIAVASVIVLATLVRVGLYCAQSGQHQIYDDDDDKTVLSADDDEESQRSQLSESKHSNYDLESQRNQLSESKHSNYDLESQSNQLSESKHSNYDLESQSNQLSESKHSNYDLESQSNQLEVSQDSNYGLESQRNQLEVSQDSDEESQRNQLAVSQHSEFHE